MPTELICIAGYVIAAALVVVAVLARQKAANLQALIQDAATHYDAARKAAQRSGEELAEAREKIEQQRSAIAKFERTIEDSRAKFTSFNRELQDLRERYESEAGRSRLDVEHLREQANVLTEQLKESEAARLAVERELKKLESDTRERAKTVEANQSAEAQKLKGELADARKQMKRQDQEVARLKSILQKVDPIETRRHKQRAAKLEQLYVSMKGLREMADERNHNWEVALRKLSAYIVGQDEIGPDGKPRSIGPLVGAALERIGQTLVRDEEESRAADLAAREALRDRAQAKKDGSRPAEADAEGHGPI